MSDLDTLRQSYLSRVSAAPDTDALEQVRLAALGKKGEISGMMKELGRMTPEERQTTGAALNRLTEKQFERVLRRIETDVVKGVPSLGEVLALARSEFDGCL